jgi:hypothetical protein
MDNFIILRAEEWKARIQKWRQPLEVVLATTKDDLSEYLDTKLYQYALYDLGDDNLWDVFKYNFKNFSRTTFNRLDRTELLRLRAVLYCGGVYVHQDHKNLSIAQSLVNLVQEEEQHIWSAADINKARTDLQKGPITSVFISLKRGNQRLQPPGQPLTSAYLRHLAELEHFHRAYRALPITKALPVKALPVDTNTNEPPKTGSFTFEALPLETHEPVDIDERNQLAVPSTEPSISTLETDEPVETDEPAVPFANTTEPSMEGTFTLETDESSVEGAFTLEIDERAEPSVEDAPTFNTLTLSLSTTTLISSQSIPLTNGCLAYTLTSPPSPLRSIPATGFGQLHTFQQTNESITPTYTSAAPTFTEFGRFQALQRTGVG